MLTKRIGAALAGGNVGGRALRIRPFDAKCYIGKKTLVSIRAKKDRAPPELKWNTTLALSFGFDAAEFQATFLKDLQDGGAGNDDDELSTI